MSFLLHLDTIAAAVQGNLRVGNRMLQHQGSLHLSASKITGTELWLLHPNTPLRFMQGYTSLVRYIPILNIDEPIAHRAASIGGRLAAKGTPMETMDLFVAATAIVHKLTLVTGATPSFALVPGLTLADWMIP